MKTKAYIQISGYIDQTVLGMTKDDSGGELGELSDFAFCPPFFFFFSLFSRWHRASSLAKPPHAPFLEDDKTTDLFPLFVIDPHGADLLGNPLGGLVFSSGLPSGDNSTEQQVVEWNNCEGSLSLSLSAALITFPSLEGLFLFFCDLIARPGSHWRRLLLL